MGDQWVEMQMAVGEGRGRSGFASEMQLRDFMITPNPPGSPRPFSIMSTPSLQGAFAQGLGSTRGMIAHGDYVWYVRGAGLRTYNGTSFVVVSAAGVAGSPPVHMVGAGPNQIVLVDGAGNEYLATTSALSAITPPAGNFADVAWMDGYTIAIRAGTDEFYISALDDPTTWGALDFSTADAVSDTLVGCIVDHRELVLFGKRHIEFWYNAGASPFPFLRQQPGVAERGCYAAASIAKYDNAIYFLGDDLRVYRMRGYVPEPISTPWIETQIPGTDLIAGQVTPANVRGSVYVQGGQAFYCLGFLGQRTIVYDIGAGLWHVRGHYSGTVGYVDVVNFVDSTGDMDIYACVNDGSAYVDAYQLSIESGSGDDTGAGASTSRIMVLPPVDGGGHRIFESAVGVSTQKVSSGSIDFAYSDDGGATYTTHPASGSLTQDHVQWTRCGSYRRRNHKLTVLSTQRVAIDAVHHRVEVGL
jgi:hypothetical protein